MKPARCAVILLVALAGCGGAESSEPRLGGAAPRVETVAALGDSITAGSPLWDPSERVRRQIGQTNPESQYGYWAQLRLKGTRFRNCGVFGERTDEIAARLPRCVRGAKYLIVQGGINDIAQGRPVGAAAGNLRAMVEDGRRRKLRVALTEVLPWNNGYPAAAAPIKRLNRLIARIGRTLGVPVLPWYRALEDPRAPGRMKPELTIDGDHPSVAGYRRLAARVRLP